MVPNIKYKEKVYIQLSDDEETKEERELNFSKPVTSIPTIDLDSRVPNELIPSDLKQIVKVSASNTMTNNQVPIYQNK